MKKLVLCMSVLCSLEAYAIDREGLANFAEAVMGKLSKSYDREIVRDIESQYEDMCDEKMVLVEVPSSWNISLDFSDRIKRKLRGLIFEKEHQKTYYEFLSEYLADFYQKLLERDPKAISQATGVIVVICGVMKFFLQKFI